MLTSCLLFEDLSLAYIWLAVWILISCLPHACCLKTYLLLTYDLLFGYLYHAYIMPAVLRLISCLPMTCCLNTYLLVTYGLLFSWDCWYLIALELELSYISCLGDCLLPEKHIWNSNPNPDHPLFHYEFPKSHESDLLVGINVAWGLQTEVCIHEDRPKFHLQAAQYDFVQWSLWTLHTLPADFRAPSTPSCLPSPSPRAALWSASVLRMTCLYTQSGSCQVNSARS